MTAEEIIAQIKAMPPAERAKVIDFIHAFQERRSDLLEPNDSRFKKAIEWVFSEHQDLLRKLN